MVMLSALQTLCLVFRSKQVLDAIEYQSYLKWINFQQNPLMKPIALALMEAASFCAGVRHKRYSVQQESAPD